jgi:regulator of protease activity HflC (stomatin/prohibitin superfamily)
MKSIYDKPTLNLNGFLVALLFVLLGLYFFTTLNYTISSIILPILLIISVSSFTILGPNEARVVSFFGSYMGTIKTPGFRFTIPFSTSVLVPLKMINFNTEKLKVNDLNGNPVEVGAVVVWRVRDAAQACFNVDNYKNFIFNQSESAVRTIAAHYPYDSSEDKVSLRGNSKEITQELTKELHEKLAIAGIEVSEVKLSHLAYAPEIASAMLKKQQAVAVLDARKYLIENASLIAKEVVTNFDENNQVSADVKAKIISNILITLISDKEVNPVIEI